MHFLHACTTEHVPWESWGSTQPANDQKPNASVCHVFLTGFFSVPKFGVSSGARAPICGFLSVPNFGPLCVPKFGYWPCLRCFSSRRRHHRKICPLHQPVQGKILHTGGVQVTRTYHICPHAHAICPHAHTTHHVSTFTYHVST